MAKANEQPAKQAQKPDALVQSVQGAVDEWYARNMHNTVVSRDTDVHNLIHSVKAELVQSVVAAVRQSVPNQE